MLPDGSAVVEMLPDFAVMREPAPACQRRHVVQSVHKEFHAGHERTNSSGQAGSDDRACCRAANAPADAASEPTEQHDCESLRQDERGVCTISPTAASTKASVGPLAARSTVWLCCQTSRASAHVAACP